MSEKLNKIIEQIEQLSVSDALALVKGCEEKWGVSAAAPVAAAAVAVAAVEEKKDFEVLLTSAGATKMEVMKMVRAITQKDLMAAKKFVEDATEATPSSLGTYDKVQADKIAADLKAIGASVRLG